MHGPDGDFQLRHTDFDAGVFHFGVQFLERFPLHVVAVGDAIKRLPVGHGVGHRRTAAADFGGCGGFFHRGLFFAFLRFLFGYLGTRRRLGFGFRLGFGSFRLRFCFGFSGFGFGLFLVLRFWIAGTVDGHVGGDGVARHRERALVGSCFTLLSSVVEDVSSAAYS